MRSAEAWALTAGVGAEGGAAGAGMERPGKGPPKVMLLPPLNRQRLDQPLPKGPLHSRLLPTCVHQRPAAKWGAGPHSCDHLCARGGPGGRGGPDGRAAAVQTQCTDGGAPKVTRLASEKAA